MEQKNKLLLSSLLAIARMRRPPTAEICFLSAGYTQPIRSNELTGCTFLENDMPESLELCPHICHQHAIQLPRAVSRRKLIWTLQIFSEEPWRGITKRPSQQTDHRIAWCTGPQGIVTGHDDHAGDQYGFSYRQPTLQCRNAIRLHVTKMDERK